MKWSKSIEKERANLVFWYVYVTILKRHKITRVSIEKKLLLLLSILVFKYTYIKINVDQE